MSRKFQTGLIFESFEPISNNQLMILEDTKISGTPKARFKVRLQTLEEKNNNGRWYDSMIGREIVETLRPKALGRKLYMEVDHPMAAGDDNFARKRAITVELKNCGALISELGIKGKEIIGEAETLSGFLGPDFYKTIMYDKADIGFSLRMFGRTQVEESTGLTRIVKPIRPITYDIVTNPSHSTAKIMEFVTEDINSFLIDSSVNAQLINETTLINDDLQLEDANESVYDYLERVVNNTFRTIGPVEFRL